MVIDGVKHVENSGHMSFASNNDAELEAALQGLSYARSLVPNDEEIIRHNVTVTLVSDSQLVLGWTNGTYSFRQEEKIEKYKQLQLLVKLMDVKTRWVEGHTGDEYNERCDELANIARTGQTKTKTKKKIPPQKNNVSVTFKVIANRELLDKFTFESISHANNGPYPTGSNYWTTMFVDKLQELLDNNKYFAIEEEK